MLTYYVDGKYVRADQAVIPVDDLAILRGFGVFDLLRTYNGKPFFLKEHVERLLNSAKEVQLEVPWTVADITGIALKILAINDLEEANIRMVITAGSSPDFITPQGNPRLLVLISPTPSLPRWWYEKGVKIVTMPSTRTIPGAKSIDYISATLALKEARKVNAIEAVYVDGNGQILEGTTSNIFAFVGNRLVTPGEKILSGVTRRVILELADNMFEVEIRSLNEAELLNADEVFITGTNKGLVPVVQVNDGTIGGGVPGPSTRKLMAAMEKTVQAVTEQAAASGSG
ncbi:MAG: branched-chain amino acid aminotransferase [Desulfobacteraceae bacterium]|nr:branched-chain amino acid aminotransferase [Desulfobacteraceae bacterium]